MSSTTEIPVIQRIKKTPLVIVGIVLELLRIHFGQNSVRFPWNPDPEASKLILEPIDQMDFEVCQKRPAIYVARGPITYQRIAMDDLHINNPREGEKTFTKLENTEFFTTPTNVLLEWAETWTIKQFSPKLKTIHLNLIERVNAIARGEPYACGTEYGKGSFG